MDCKRFSKQKMKAKNLRKEGIGILEENPEIF